MEVTTDGAVGREAGADAGVREIMLRRRRRMETTDDDRRRARMLESRINHGVATFHG